MKIEKIVCGQMAANCYLVYEKRGGDCIVIDPGDEADFIMGKIEGLELKPKAILATHGHFDHIMAVNEIKLYYKIPFLIHKEDEKLLSWMRKSAVHFTGVDPGPQPEADRYLKNNLKLRIKNEKFVIMHTPGHTPGGVCFLFKDEGVLFSGDTIFANGTVGRTDLPYSNGEYLKKSVEKILRLPGETIIYPGHGEETTVGQERKLLNTKKFSKGRDLGK